MPPKKADPKDAKKPGGPGGASAFVDDDYADLATLPPLNNYIFTTLNVFKYKRNLSRIQQQLSKHYSFAPEVTVNSAKFKTVTRDDIINYARAKQYITEEEMTAALAIPQGGDVAKVLGGVEKYTEVFAKTTVDVVMSHEVPARRLKKDAPPAVEIGEDVEMTIWLKDFPNSPAEIKALYALKQGIHGVFILEEKFVPDEADDYQLAPTNSLNLSPSQFQLQQDEEKKKADERAKIEFTLEERLKPLQAALEIPKLLATVSDKDLKQLFTVQRLKFRGPDPPVYDNQTQTSVNPDGSIVQSEVDPMTSRDQELLKEEDQVIADFVVELQSVIHKCSRDLQEYRLVRKQLAPPKPLWPYSDNDPTLLKIKEEEERRKREEEARKIEEERKAAELAAEQAKAAAPVKGGKPGAPPAKGAPGGPPTQSRAQLNSAGGDRPESEEKREAPKKLPSSKDEEEKEWNFQHLDQVLTEITSANTGIGGILAAMIYQIDTDSKKGEEKTQQADQGTSSLSQIPPTKNQLIKIEDSKRSAKKLETQAQKQLNDYFDDIFNKLSIEHNLRETSFKHQFDENKKLVKDSPYQSVTNENDRLSQLSKAFTFLNGDSLSTTEGKTLAQSLIPGVNNRFGMPPTPPVHKAQRESDLSAILSFSPLPPSETKRSLILRACEQMMKAREPEREFFFLDRNFVEKYDAQTLRQLIASSLRYQPDLAYQYYQSEDALLLSIYFKNPPGRLLRRQWTHELRTAPDFQTWRTFIKHDPQAVHFDTANLIDIDPAKVGVIRANTKYSYPCDNSLIRSEKHLIGGRRIGASLVVKDNLVFGVRERPESFAQKLSIEEDELLRNRESWFAQSHDRRCDFWLEFENGVKMLVEMVDKLTPNMNEIPLHEPDQIAAAISKADNSIIQEPTGEYIEGPSGMDIKQEEPATTMVQSQENLSGDQSPTAHAAQQRLMSAQTKNRPQSQDNYEALKGARLNFTFDDGLALQILPNGDVSQTRIISGMAQSEAKKQPVMHDSKPQNQVEKSRLITRLGQVIRYLADGNFQILCPDGTVTIQDKRKGIWTTVNSKGVKRVRKLRDNSVFDEPRRLKQTEKIDPETNAKVYVREDGVLTINYIDESRLVMFADGTEILTRKEGQTVFTLVKKEGYIPVRQIFDPVKARARTIIGLGGTDALMGIESLMERTNDGRITEVLMPDKTVVQTYMERQELEGYNNFMTNMVHIVKRDDFSVIKVRQDGEVVVISANERAYLNNIGKQQPNLGHDDYDYFFELFGVAAERRSGVYTAQLSEAKLWMLDEEGNHFIVYANGDSVEKLSVSFDLNQLVEGIDRKEPDSPRALPRGDGEHIEEECKFLPPPKSVAHPRLFIIKNDGKECYEYLNSEQLEYLFRCRHKDAKLPTVIQSSQNQVTVDGEKAISHFFLTKKPDVSRSATVLSVADQPKIPQSVELVNQTVSVPKEPVSEDFVWRQILEYRNLTKEPQLKSDFENAIKRYQAMRSKQAEERNRLKVVELKTADHITVENRILMRIAREKGIDIARLVGDEYQPLKEIESEERRIKFLEDLDKNFFAE